MIKSFVAATILLGVSLAAAVPAGAAECETILALLAPCPTTPPPPVPPLPGSLPEVAPAPAPVPGIPPAPSPAPAVPAVGQGVAMPDAAQRIYQLVNQERASAGLAALAVSSQIASIAADHSLAMADRHDIYHNDAYFSPANRRALGAGALGENVAMNSTIDDAHQRLMASPGHRANILNPGFNTVGMAVVRDKSGTLYVTQDFAYSKGAPTPAAPVARNAATKPAVPARSPSPAGVIRPAVVPTEVTVPAPDVAPAQPVTPTPAARVSPVTLRAPRSDVVVASSDATATALLFVVAALAVLALLGGAWVAVGRLGTKAPAYR